MGGVPGYGGYQTVAQARERAAKSKMVNRPQKLKSVRDTFTRLTGNKPRPVSKALMYKDFTALEKRRYATLMANDKNKKKERLETPSRLDQAKSYVKSVKTLLG